LNWNDKILRGNGAGRDAAEHGGPFVTVRPILTARAVGPVVGQLGT